MKHLSRKLFVGSNVVVASLLVLALVGAVNYIADWCTKRYSLTADLTEGRRYSFSDRTRLLLKGLDQDVRLTALFVADDKDEVAQQRKRLLEDLLQQYAAANGRIEVRFVDPQENPAPLQELVRRITLARTLKPDAEGKLLAEEEALRQGMSKETYNDLKKTYEVNLAIAQFLELQKDLAALLNSDQGLFQQESANAELSPQAKDFFFRVAASLEGEQQNLEAFADLLKGDFGAVLDALHIVPKGMTLAKAKEISLMIPGYAMARNTMSDRVDSAAQLLDSILSVGQRLAAAEGAKMPASAKAVLDQARERYKPYQDRLTQFAARLKELNAPDSQTIELEKLRDDLKYLNSVVVEIGNNVRVLNSDDLWPVAPGHSRYEEDAPRAFLGEETISAALLAMTSRQRPAAVFAKWGAMPVSEDIGFYTELARQVSRNNFTIANWNLQQQPEMPKIENASKIVLVVLPPDPPNPQMFTMPPGPESYAPVKKFIDDGGSAVFFLRSPFVAMAVFQQPPMVAKAPYEDMLREFGLEVNTDVATALSVSLPDGTTRLVPPLEVTRYPSPSAAGPVHPIVSRLQGVKCLLAAPAVIARAAKLPQGVTVWPLIQTPRRDDCWAERDLEQWGRKGTGSFDAAADVASPYDVAVAVDVEPVPPEAPKEQSGATPRRASSRLVVFADDYFIADQLLRSGLQLTGQGLALVDNPGNAELVLNSLLWLAHEEDRISVGPKAQQARRIGDIDPNTYLGLKIAVWGVLPVLIVALGIVVYIVRKQKR